MTKSIIPNSLEKYIENHTTPVSDSLQQIERDTYLNVLQPHMLSGSYQGQLLSLLSRIIQPKQILEVGTFTGYSALCLAEGLLEHATLHTIDVDEELMQRTKTYFEQSPYKNQIHLHIGRALDIIPQLDQEFDLAFIDADKTNYANYFDLVVDKMKKNGLIIVDNVLWKGRVLDEVKDKKTKQMDDFNKKIHEDDRVDNVLLPVRDGLLLILKK